MLAAPVTSACRNAVVTASENSWTYPELPNVRTFATGGDDTRALKPARFQAPWNAAVIVSVGAPLPTEISGFKLTVAVPEAVASKELVAVIVTFCEVEIPPGAVYVAE